MSGTPGHLPERDRGRLLAVERLSRYRLAARIAGGRRVLDAGAGDGDGARVLAQAGAREVVALDIAADMLAELDSDVDGANAITIETGDVRDTGQPSGSFGLVVCLSVLDHLTDPSVALDELVRVLDGDGILVVSVVDGGALGPDAGAALQSALAERLPHVALARQTDHLVSTVLPWDGHADPIVLARPVSGDPTTAPVAVLAFGSRVALPDLPALASATEAVDPRTWLDALDTRADALHGRDAEIAELRGRLAESATTTSRLLDAEQELARIPDLQQRIDDLQNALRAAQNATAAAHEQAAVLDERLMGAERVLADVLGSPSWQVTKPLRAAKHLLR